MRDSRPQLLDDLFDDTSLLRNVQQRAIALIKLNNAVRSLLPAQLHPFCRVANFRRGVLILETVNASWLMRLRYEQSTLLSTLRADILPSLASIDIRINPDLATNIVYSERSYPTPAEVEAAPPRRHLSKQSGEQLKELASRAPERLRIKLERLAALAEESAKTTNRSK